MVLTLVQRYGSGFVLGDLSYENEHHKARLHDVLLLSTSCR